VTLVILGWVEMNVIASGAGMKVYPVTALATSVADGSSI
jgi:hypothetical protein